VSIEPGERRHTINGPHYDTSGHNPSLCLLELPHCGPCWVRGEPMPQHLRDYFSSLAIWLNRGSPGPLCIDGHEYRRRQKARRRRGRR
jgi:hypothetical protein